ncbi:MAG: tetratricopeptide repeat protein [Candidatus Krumholzibacteriia bacterium]
MKICPFLVAGQSMPQPQEGLAGPSERPKVAFPAADEETVDLLLVADVEGAADAPRPGDPEASGAADARGSRASGPDAWSTGGSPGDIECLGEPCRFFHAGGCRFDSLFENHASGDVLVAAADGGDGEVPQLPFLLQEVWSLQRESLKEMIGGFRRLESAHSELQSGVTSQLESTSSRYEEARVAQPPADFVQLLESRFEALEAVVERLDGSLRDVLGASNATLQGQLQDTRDAVRSTLTESGAALQASLRESLTESTDSVLSSLRSSQANVQSRIEEMQEELQGGIERSVAQIRSSVGETRTSVQELLARAAADSRSEMEHSLARVLDEIQQVRELRAQVDAALDELRREIREVAAVAGRLESSTVLTQELLDEHRQYSLDAKERDQREEARRHNNAGVLCYHQGAYDASVEHFRKALELDSTLAEAYNNLGLSYTELGRDEEASDAFRRALELDPAVGQAYNNLGYLYYRRGDLDHAVEMYERAIQRNSDTSAAYTNLGNALYRMQRIDESVAAWRRAVEIDPSNHKASTALERLGLEIRPN